MHMLWSCFREEREVKLLRIGVKLLYLTIYYLQGGLNPTNSQGLIERSSVTSPKEGVPTSTATEDQNDRLPQSLTRQVSNTPIVSTQTSKVSSADAVTVDVVNSQTEAISIHEKSQSPQSSSDILERARAAIASAERASAAARAAAELVKAKLPR